MNAASRSFSPQRRQSRRPMTSSRAMPSNAARVSTVSPLPLKPQRQKVERLHSSRQLLPAWLQVLVVLQRGSDWITFFLIATTLTIYSWTVYTQQQWAQEYRKLETLQRHERQLTTTNEVIKDQLAQQAERPATGLVNPSTANTILLPPAPERQLTTPPTQITHAEPVATTPLGY